MGKTLRRKGFGNEKFPTKKLDTIAPAVRTTFDHTKERNQFCVYINIACMALLQNIFPKAKLGVTVGSLAFKDKAGGWGFVFDTQNQNGIFDLQFHLVILHQVKQTVRMLDFTLPYWKEIGEKANLIETDTALIDTSLINPQNKDYVYCESDEVEPLYGAVFEQDREQNKIFHE